MLAETVAEVGALDSRWGTGYALIRGNPLCRYGDLVPGHITSADQEEPPRQMERGEDREPSRTISAALPPRSGFVQLCVAATAHEAAHR